MRAKFPGVVERARIREGEFGSPKGATFGAFDLEGPEGKLGVIACDGSDTGWDHVSVSRPDRLPTWNEMEWVKRRFFESDETCMQLHVPVVDHINHCGNCLHIWRPVNVEIPVPPKECV